MSNTVRDTQDALLAAIGYLSENAAEQVKADKTVTAIVKSCVDATTGQYSLKYNGGKIYAYSTNDASYKENQSVYVLVPESDFTKKKIIVGLASLASDDDVSSVISSVASDYNVSTCNAFALSDGCKYPVGLNSFLASDGGVLYADGDASKGIEIGVGSVSLAVDEEGFKESVVGADMLMLRGRFRTYLPRAHRAATKAEYGVTVTLEYSMPENEDGGSVKEVSYTLSSREMSGNPFQFASESTQYAMFEFDSENFKKVKSVIVFSRGFVEESDAERAEEYGDDIFISDVELLGLTKIAAVSSDGMYRLRRQMLSGSLSFSATASEDSQIKFGEQLLKSNTTDLSSSAIYYWFVSDPTISKKTSKGYDVRGGLGWRLLSGAGQSSTITFVKSDNPAYQTEYKCSCVYKDTVVLTDTFVVTNMGSKCDVKLSSNLGTKFAFDRGVPTITCKVDPIPDNVSYEWSTTSRNGAFSTLLSESEAEEELKSVEASIKDKGDDSCTYADLVAARNAVAAAKGVVKEGPSVTVPMSSVDALVVVKCTVMTQKNSDSARYSVGSASITLRNDEVAETGTCSVVIQNGVQVFQYSEGGQSPCMESVNKDPQETLPLKALLYDVSGSKVPEKEYTVSWGFPKEDTLVLLPKLTVGVEKNEALSDHRDNGRVYFSGDGTTECDFSIKDEYDYSAVYNQIECLVTYHGEEFSQMTSFTFNKVGDNGTNGTDVVAVIGPYHSDQENEYMFAVEETTESNGTVSIKPAQGGNNNPKLELRLYQAGQEISSDNFKTSWSIQKSSSTYRKDGVAHSFPLFVDSADGVLSYEAMSDSDDEERRHLVVKGQATYGGKKYYAYRGVPYIRYLADEHPKVSLYKQLCLKDVLYNSDGSYPQYNKNQGVCIECDSPFTMDVACFGGPNYNHSMLQVRVVGNDGQERTLNEVEGVASEEVVTTKDGVEVGAHRAFAGLCATSDYSGEYTNNCVHCVLKTQVKGSDGALTAGEEFASVYMPVNATLNRYSLSSLNDWDGNKVDVNEEGGYVLAPQVGAGTKNDKNQFTGILMGTESTYGSESQNVGLLGYHDGQRSIFMDANTGNTVLGLRDSGDDKEARIELVPGGQSHIGSWFFDSERLYNITDGAGNVPFMYDGNGREAVEPTDEKWSQPDDKGGFAFGEEGIILGADPAYISVKGRALTDKDINKEDSGAVIEAGNSFELEIDPNKASIFNIYRHYSEEQAGDDTTGSQKANKKHAIVGINARGQFYTNAVEDDESSMTIGPVGGFGVSAAKRRYFGSDFRFKDQSLFKFLVDGSKEENLEKTPLHISASKSLKDEYVRPISIHGDEVALYATPAAGIHNVWKTSPNSISISQEAADIRVGTYGNFNDEEETCVETNSARFHLGKDGVETYSSKTMRLRSQEALTQTSGAGIDINSDGSDAYISLGSRSTGGDGTVKEHSGLYLGKEKAEAYSNGTFTIKQETASESGYIKISNASSTGGNVPVETTLKNSQAYIGQDGRSFLDLRTDSSSTSTLQASNRLSVKVGAVSPGKLEVKQVGADGIEISSCADKEEGSAEVYARFVPQSSGAGKINIGTGNGSLVVGEHVEASENENSFNGVTVHPGVSSNYAIFSYDEKSVSGQNGGYALFVDGKTNLKGQTTVASSPKSAALIVSAGNLVVIGEGETEYNIETHKISADEFIVIGGVKVNKDYLDNITTFINNLSQSLPSINNAIGDTYRKSDTYNRTEIDEKDKAIKKAIYDATVGVSNQTTNNDVAGYFNKLIDQLRAIYTS